MKSFVLILFFARDPMGEKTDNIIPDTLKNKP